MHKLILSLIIWGSLSSQTYAVRDENEVDEYRVNSPIQISFFPDFHKYEEDEVYVMARSILDISPEGSDLDEWGFLNLIYYTLKDLDGPERGALIDSLLKIVKTYPSLNECIEVFTGKLDFPSHRQLVSNSKQYPK